MPQSNMVQFLEKDTKCSMVKIKETSGSHKYSVQFPGIRSRYCVLFTLFTLFLLLKPARILTFIDYGLIGVCVVQTGKRTIVGNQ